MRVRPFNDREKNCNAKLVISMDANETEIINPEGNKIKSVKNPL